MSPRKKTRESVRVRVPATTANVGPGFDSLGIALQLYNTVELSLSSPPRILLEGGIAPDQTHGSMKMAMEASRLFFRKLGVEEVGLTVRIAGDVPVARGLGSSVTLRLGIVAGLNRLFGNPLKREDMLEMVATLEGHPDNAGPAIYGGLAVSGTTQSQIVCLRKRIPRDLKFVAAIPDFEVQTKKARALLPSTLPFTDAVHNVNRVALLVAAFWNGDYEAVGDFLEDRLHQPYRASLVPQLFPCLNAAKLRGAIGGWLSGSGSTIMAITLKNPKRVGEAMRKVFADAGHSCEIAIMEADHQGVAVQDA